MLVDDMCNLGNVRTSALLETKPTELEVEGRVLLRENLKALRGLS